MFKYNLKVPRHVLVCKLERSKRAGHLMGCKSDKFKVVGSHHRLAQASSIEAIQSWHQADLQSAVLFTPSHPVNKGGCARFCGKKVRKGGLCHALPLPCPCDRVARSLGSMAGADSCRREWSYHRFSNAARLGSMPDIILSTGAKLSWANSGLVFGSITQMLSALTCVDMLSALTGAEWFSGVDGSSHLTGDSCNFTNQRFKKR